MHLIYEALKKTGRQHRRRQPWSKSSRECIGRARAARSRSIPRPATSYNPIYMRKVKKVEGELYNVEFATFEAVKDPGKTRK